MFKLRPYQEECCIAFWQFVRENKGQNPLLVLPTGTGKSVIIAEIIRRFYELDNNASVLMLTHVSELVKQNFDKFQKLANIEAGIYSASIGLKENKRILFATVQSVYSKLKKDKNYFGIKRLIIIDEAHLISEKDTTVYRKVLSIFKELNSKVCICGLTATPFRTNGGYLTEQENPIFNAIAYDLSKQINSLIEQGYLSELIPYKTDEQIDTKGLHIRGGDFVDTEVMARISDENLQRRLCENIVKFAQNRKSCLVFVSGIDNCEKISSKLNDLGLNSASVNSSHTQEENDNSILSFRNNELKCIVSADQLTTGFDVPQVDLIAILRPTTSSGLWVQMLGRGMRIAENKKNCLILDFAGNTQRLGTIDDPLIRKKRKKTEGEATASVKECPNCHAFVKNLLRKCPYCGFEFPIKESKNLTAFYLSNLDLISKNADILSKIKDVCLNDEKIAVVLEMRAEKHKSKQDIECIRICFICDKTKKPLYQYFNFDKKAGYIYEKSKEFYLKHCKNFVAYPTNNDDFLSKFNELKKPDALKFIPRNFYKNRLFDEIKKEYFVM